MVKRGYQARSTDTREAPMLFYVGLDIHAKHITICVLASDGEVYRRCTVRTVKQMMQAIEGLPGPCRVCYEASTGYGRFFELLSPVADYVAVAHPGLLRLIFRSKKKNDRQDALKLAKLLYVGEVPSVHVPSSDVRAWRELITFRRHVVEKRTRAKNGVRGLLRSLGIAAPAAGKLWTRKGMQWLRGLTLDNAMHALKRDVLAGEIESLTGQLRRIEAELQRYARDSVAVQLLRSIPGVGPRTAEAAAAFIDDPHRFPDSKRLGSYFGLVPSQDQSGSTNRLGHITREGSATVRHLLTEAVWQGARRSPTIKAYWERIQRGEADRRKIAIVATAHYLIRVMWSMLKHRTVWKESAAAQAA
jgi:transposase